MKPPITRHPRRSFGRYTVRDTGITVTAIQERFRAGESVAELATDYGITTQQVEDALRFRWKNPVR